MNTDEGEVRNISHVVIHSSDLMRSIDYYKLLGFNVNRIISTDPAVHTDINDLRTIPLNQTSAGDFYCVGLSLGKEPRAITALELMEWKTPEKMSRSPKPESSLGVVRIALNVTNVMGIRERLTRHGHLVEYVERLQISSTLSAAFVNTYDPDGNWLSLMEWIKHPPQ
jgi:catechol 2,3-dioxygenase-like lactoylglutathione lyase family enzyme